MAHVVAWGLSNRKLAVQPLTDGLSLMDLRGSQDERMTHLARVCCALRMTVKLLQEDYQSGYLGSRQASNMPVALAR